MIHRSRVRRRTGIVATESVVVLPILLFLILATVVGGYGVFRYQQIALLAREGRYASVHGGQYQQETGNAAVTATDIYNNVIVPMAVNLDLSQLSPPTVTWTSSNMPYSMNGSSPDYEKPTGNTVTVTISYKWIPELYLVGPITLTSTSTVPVSY